jgi:acyl-CoA synthetase (NDP forming)
VAVLDLLRDAGLPMVDARLCADADAAANSAAAIGYPVVLKIVSADILHKTEIGGVALNLADAAAVRAAFAQVTARAMAAAPDAEIAGCLVAPMVSGGVEAILGVQNDPVFGPVVMFGLGGIFVEVLEDVTFRAAPFDVAEARRMIREIKAYKILQGVRGQPPGDVEALAQALSDLSLFAAAHGGRIESLDLNPFLVLPMGQGVMALDAVLELR